VTDKKNRVVLRATATVFVRVETGGDHNQVLFEGTLNPGELYFVPPVPGVELVTRDGGDLQVFVDGASRGSAGPAGIALKDMPLDPQALTNRQ
jgi:RodZ C-terminal domain